MIPRLYIEKEFFELLDKFEMDNNKFSIDKRIESKNQLIEILVSSQININLLESDFKKIVKKSSTYDSENWFEHILMKAWKNNNLIFEILNLSNAFQIFLLNKTKEEVDSIINDENLVCQGIEYDFQKPVSPRSKASILVNNEMNGIESVSHRCRNVIIIEPYIFAPKGSSNLVPKIPNVIKFLKTLYMDNVNVSRHISIFYHRNSEPRADVIEKKMNEIKEGLGGGDFLKISAFGHEDNLFEGNRHVITDYSIMDLQHPFDRNNSSISINFLYDKNIVQSFERVRTILEIGMKNYKELKTDSFGEQKVKFEDVLENKLFHKEENNDSK